MGKQGVFLRGSRQEKFPTFFWVGWTEAARLLLVGLLSGSREKLSRLVFRTTKGVSRGDGREAPARG